MGAMGFACIPIRLLLCSIGCTCVYVWVSAWLIACVYGCMPVWVCGYMFAGMRACVCGVYSFTYVCLVLCVYGSVHD